MKYQYFEKLTVAFLLVLFFNAFLAPKTLYSQDLSDIKKESINPSDDFRYFLKRGKEKLFLFLYSPFKNKKADYYQKLLEVRLSELNLTVSEKDIANIQTVSQRYSSTAGQLVDYLINKKITDKKDNAIKILESHIPFLEKMQNTYEYDSAEWMFIKYDIDYLKTYIDFLKGWKE